MQKVAQDAVVEVAAKYVKGGPHLWVSQMLYNKGHLSTNKLWDEYTRDNSAKSDAKGQLDKDLIKSKSFLKERVLATMAA